MSDECKGAESFFFFLSFSYLKKFLLCLKPTVISLLPAFAFDIMLCKATGPQSVVCQQQTTVGSFMVHDTSPEFARYPL